jgi:hypothetical protein
MAGRAFIGPLAGAGLVVLPELGTHVNLAQNKLDNYLVTAIPFGKEIFSTLSKNETLD